MKPIDSWDTLSESQQGNGTQLIATCIWNRIITWIRHSTLGTPWQGPHLMYLLSDVTNANYVSTLWQFSRGNCSSDWLRPSLYGCTRDAWGTAQWARLVFKPQDTRQSLVATNMWCTRHPSITLRSTSLLAPPSRHKRIRPRLSESRDLRGPIRAGRQRDRPAGGAHWRRKWIFHRATTLQYLADDFAPRCQSRGFPAIAHCHVVSRPPMASFQLYDNRYSAVSLECNESCHYQESLQRGRGRVIKWIYG